MYFHVSKVWCWRGQKRVQSLRVVAQPQHQKNDNDLLSSFSLRQMCSGKWWMSTSGRGLCEGSGWHQVHVISMLSHSHQFFRIKKNTFIFFQVFECRPWTMGIFLKMAPAPIGLRGPAEEQSLGSWPMGTTNRCTSQQVGSTNLASWRSPIEGWRREI